MTEHRAETEAKRERRRPTTSTNKKKEGQRTRRGVCRTAHDASNTENDDPEAGWRLMARKQVLFPDRRRSFARDPVRTTRDQLDRMVGGPEHALRRASPVQLSGRGGSWPMQARSPAVSTSKFANKAGGGRHVPVVRQSSAGRARTPQRCPPGPRRATACPAGSPASRAPPRA